MTSTVSDRLAGVTASLASKAPVRMASTADLTLSGLQTVDGVTGAADDRILVKDNTTASENGIYLMKSGAWVRSLDFDGTRDVVTGTFVVIAEGTAGAGTLWRISTTGDITIGTTSIAFALMTVDSASAFIITLLDDADSGTALATLVAAGTAIANTFTAIQTFDKGQVWAKGGDIASASPLVIDTDGFYFDVTGTTGFSQMTVTAGRFFMLQFDGALTMTDGANLDLAGANITTAAGDRGLFFATAGNTVEMLSYHREGGEPLGSGRLVQMVNTLTGAVATGTTTTPNDDTIPQITEGDEYMTLAITPKNTANRLVIQVVLHLANSATDFMTGALFQDSTAPALAAGQARISTANNYPFQLNFIHEMAAGTISATTFRVRAGNAAAGTTTFNGQSGGRIMGGVMASSITILEIAA